VTNKDQLGETSQLGEIREKLEREIVERKSVEETLRHLQRQHEVIVNSVSDGINVLDLDENITFANPSAAEMLGWNVHELQGQPAHTTLHHSFDDGSSHPIESCPIHISMHNGTPCRVTNAVFWCKDGTPFRVDYSCTPIVDDQGRVTGSLVVFKDKSEELLSADRLKLQAQQYRLLFETNPSPMWVFDTKTSQMLAVNEAAIVQYGYSRDEFLKLTVTDLLSSEDVPALSRARAVSSPTLTSHFDGQFRHVRKDGSPLVVEIHSTAVIWEGVRARIVTAIGVTKWEKADRSDGV
jgi:PAS domain S-box-containing protein